MVEVSVSALSLNEEGLLIDFRDLKCWTAEILDKLDHQCLNDISYFKELNPSSENIARLIYDQLAEKTKTERISVSRVIVWESEDAKVTYRAQ